jgi:tetratricopeptide (TPR) repeat protein
VLLLLIQAPILRSKLHAMTPRSVANSNTSRSLSCACWFLCLFVTCSCPFIAQISRAQEESYAKAESLVRNHQWDEGLSALAPLLQHDPKNLKALNLAGLASIGKGDTQTAEKYFNRAIAVDPQFVPALKNLAVSEFNAQKYTESESHLQAAEGIAPEDPAVHFYLGEIFYLQKNCQQAETEFGQVHDLGLRSPDAGAHLAICFLHTKDQPRALALLDLLQVDKLNPPAQFDLALALDNAGLPQRAIPYIDAVNARFPDSYAIAFDRLIIAIDAKNFVKAIEAAKHLIADGHDTAEVNSVLAEAYEGNSDFQLAFDAYRRAINLAPDDEENYIDLASLCLNRRSFNAGMKVIEVALTTHPISGRLVFMRGLIHATQGDFELAEADFKLSEKLSPDKNLGAIGLGASYLQGGQEQQAIQVLRARLAEKPGDPSLLYLLGESLIRAGAEPGTPAYAEAQNSLEKSTTLDPDLCLPHIALGTIYLDENRAKEAAEQFEKARSIDPTERSAYSHLAVAYKRLGETDKATGVLGVLKGMNDREHEGALSRMKSASGDSGQQLAPGDNPANTQE